MNEQERLEEIFDINKWKDKYHVRWCDLCDTAYISCKVCSGSICNGHACTECSQDFDEFNKAKTSVYEYITPEEREVYEKFRRIKRFILETLSRGDKEIDWHKLNDQGKLSQLDRKYFLPALVDQQQSQQT